MIQIWKHEIKGIWREPKFWIPFIVPPTLIVLAQLFSQKNSLDLSLFLLVGVLLGTMSVSLTADTFAGEKERKTLETLLISPIPRNQILWAKLLSVAPVPIGLGITAQLLMSLPFVSTESNSIAFPIIIQGVFYTVLSSMFISSFTLLISLKVDSVRSAAQLSLILILPLFFVTQIFGATLLTTSTLMAATLFFFTISSVILFWLGIRAFKRLNF
tara:strand:- start:1734 stop:2378 length:645 start_codon:yes stop_codon:yes gene_type:complete